MSEPKEMEAVPQPALQAHSLRCVAMFPLGMFCCLSPSLCDSRVFQGAAGSLGACGRAVEQLACGDHHVLRPL